jgi:hypothetical protein
MPGKWLVALICGSSDAVDCYAENLTVKHGFVRFVRVVFYRAWSIRDLAR